MSFDNNISMSNFLLPKKLKHRHHYNYKKISTIQTALLVL